MASEYDVGEPSQQMRDYLNAVRDLVAHLEPVSASPLSCANLEEGLKGQHADVLLHLVRAQIPFVSDMAKKMWLKRMTHYEVNGRAYSVEEEFAYADYPTPEECHKAANNYLDIWPNDCVLADDGTSIIMARANDEGIAL